jgi:hypothetical protein
MRQLEAAIDRAIAALVWRWTHGCLTTLENTDMATNNRAKNIPATEVVLKALLAAISTPGMVTTLKSKGGNTYFGTQTDSELTIGGVVGRLHVAWNDLRDAAAVEAASVEREVSKYEHETLEQLKAREARLRAQIAARDAKK